MPPSSSASPRPQVTILQRRLVQYRVPLFERLRARCDDAGIDLRVVYGDPSPTDARRDDSGALAWGDDVASRWFTVRGHELLWQPCPASARRSELLVLTQENKILSNYPLLAARALGRSTGRRLAYWGHGQNLQSTNPDGLSEQWKRLLLTRVDWWFAYNERRRAKLVDDGFPAERTTALENAIDNVGFVADLAAVSDAQLDGLRASIDLAPGAPLGLYCGALYADKRVDQLADVGKLVAERDPTFRLVVIGDGPARGDLERRLAGAPWATCVGAVYGIDKAAWFRLATVQISPGAVGLHVLDSFAAGVPLFTTTSALHGPEIDYLDDGRNGFVVDDAPAAQADAILGLLADPDRLRIVSEAGRRDADRYTLDNMVDNFLGGITACLAMPPMRRRSAPWRRGPA